MRCPFCNHSELDETIFPYPGYRHSDFKILSRASLRVQCRNCQTIFNSPTGKAVAGIEEIYKDDGYFKVKKTHYVSFEDTDSNESVSVYQARAQFLKSYLPQKHPAILDIGCLDGKMLSVFDQLYDSIDLHGFDINPNIDTIFPKADNYFFWSEDLSKIPCRFDAVIVANVIQYVPDITLFLDQLKRLLNPKGFIYVEVADFSLNPYTMLYDDQMLHYSAAVLENIFNSSGFKFVRCKNNWTKRNTAGIAVIEDIKHEFKPVTDLSSILSYFKEVERKLHEIDHDGRIGVLGSTVNAAFLNYLLGEMNSVFVDENMSRVGDEFYGKPIIHPDRLKSLDLIIVPYKGTGKEIRKRFEKKYKAKFLCL